MYGSEKVNMCYVDRYCIWLCTAACTDVVMNAGLVNQIHDLFFKLKYHHICRHSAGSMLGNSRSQWASIKPVLARSFVFAKKKLISC